MFALSSLGGRKFWFQVTPKIADETDFMRIATIFAPYLLVLLRSPAGLSDCIRKFFKEGFFEINDNIDKKATLRGLPARTGLPDVR